MKAALTGNYKAEHLFALTQALELFDIYTEKIENCDRIIALVLQRLQQLTPDPQQTMPKAKHQESNNKCTKL